MKTTRQVSGLSVAFALALLLSGCGVGEGVVTATAAPSPSPVSAATEDKADFGMIATPNSTAFLQVGYSSLTGTLKVTFRKSGISYEYYDVPYSVWDAFSGADSLGKYFNTHIKDQYDYKRLD